MRIIGWILTILGCLWALTGASHIIIAGMGSQPGPGQHFVSGILTLALAAFAVWAGRKLRAKADHAKALKTIR